MMACEEGCHLAVRHAVLQRRQSRPCQQAALGGLRARHDCWESCKVPRRSLARNPSVHSHGTASVIAMTARALKHGMQGKLCSACGCSSSS